MAEGEPLARSPDLLRISAALRDKVCNVEHSGRRKGRRGVRGSVERVKDY